jgi:IclR family acetate operon transcriptional repressor
MRTLDFVVDWRRLRSHRRREDPSASPRLAGCTWCTVEREVLNVERQASGVQSVERALTLLETLADAGGELSLTQMAAAAGLPLPTIHRLVRTLVDRGYIRQLPSRRYSLGPRLINLGERASGTLAEWARPRLADLVTALGETANLTMLDGDKVAYVAQVESPHPMRMFTEVGNRVPLHSTGVGKVLLAQMNDRDLASVVQRIGLPALTPASITDVDVFISEIRAARERGYAMDDEETQLGVRCVAVPLLGGPSTFALSVSGPAVRMGSDLIQRAVPLLQAAAKGLVDDVTGVQTDRTSA